MANRNGVEMTIVWLVLLIVTWLGDLLVARFVATLPPKSLLRAADTVIHGIIGALSWQLVCLINPKLYFNICYPSRLSINYECMSVKERSLLSVTSLYNLAIAFTLSSAVDLDHIITDIIHMIQGHELPTWQRGWFHFVLPPLLFSLLFYISSFVFKSLYCVKVATLVLICIIGHDIRDALHHGLWLQPLGVTPRFPYWLYVCLTMLFPFMASGIVSLLMLRIHSAPSLSVISVI